jgi:hypothetical protein
MDHDGSTGAVRFFRFLVLFAPGIGERKDSVGLKLLDQFLSPVVERSPATDFGNGAPRRLSRAGLPAGCRTRRMSRTSVAPIFWLCPACGHQSPGGRGHSPPA